MSVLSPYNFNTKNKNIYNVFLHQTTSTVGHVYYSAILITWGKDEKGKHFSRKDRNDLNGPRLILATKGVIK
jgi:hypothetical protein